jgi:UPF0755 protein
MKRYAPDGGGTKKARRALRSVLTILILILIGAGAGAVYIVKLRLEEREARRIENEKIENAKAETVTHTLWPGMNVFKLHAYLQNQGFSEEEVAAAFTSELSHFNANLPAGFTKEVATLEGLIFPETLEFYQTDTAADILRRFISEQTAVIQENDLVAKYEKQGLSLYQGLILASIVQSEVGSQADQKQVAQVFLKRYRENIMLGSDVTAIYAANLGCFENTGAICDARDADVLSINSPYNTRKYKGLPPAPISAPGLSALLSIADPASGDYLYFLSGDDDQTYFAKTEKEHELNKKNHCAVKCNIF